MIRFPGNVMLLEDANAVAQMAAWLWQTVPPQHWVEDGGPDPDPGGAFASVL